MVGDIRSQWIEMLSSHQECDFWSTGFMICDLHFPQHSFIEENGKKVLKRDSIPEIFDVKPNVACSVEPTNGLLSSIKNDDCDLSRNFNVYDTPNDGNNGTVPHEIEFVSLNENYSIVQKPDLMIDSSNFDQKRKFVDGKNETHA